MTNDSCCYSASLLCGIGLFIVTGAQGQSYPTKSIRMIVPFPAGGNTDILGRAVGQKLSELLGQQVVIDNRGGAGGVIGTELAAKSPPDGYTILFASSSHGINPGLRKLPYDSDKDFAAITSVASLPMILVVHPSLPVKTANDLVRLAKSRKSELNYASSGGGTIPHLAAELFKSRTGANLVHIPYKGNGPAVIDLLAGQVELMISGMSSVMPHVKSGKLRAIAVASGRRSQAAPEVPTFAESGIAGAEAMSWFVLLAPAATPRDIVNRLNGETVKVLRLPDVRQRFETEGADPIGNTPEETTAFIRDEISKWTRVIRDAGIKLE